MEKFSNPKVSILVPVYGVEKYIAQCAESLFNQSYQNIEYIFVNDCTRDNSIQILESIIEKYPNRKQQIKIISHAENKGLVNARKTAIENATGEYIVHVDSDDYITSDAIQKLVKVVINDCKIDIVFGDYTHVYKDKTRDCHHSLIFNVDEVACNMIKRNGLYNIWNNLIRKSLYKDLEIPNINNGEDYVTMPRLVSRAKSIAYTGECTYMYTHYNVNSFQNMSRNNQYVNDLRKALDYLFSYYGKENIAYLTALNTAAYIFDATNILNLPSLQKIKEYSIYLKNNVLIDVLSVKFVYRLVMTLYMKNKFFALLLLTKCFRLTR